MPASFEAQARRSTYFKKPGDTNANTIYTCGSNTVATIEALSQTSEGAASATVWINDGTTDWVVQWAESLVTDSHHTETFGNPVLKPGWSVKVKSSVADKITFMLTVAEELGKG